MSNKIIDVTRTQNHTVVFLMATNMDPLRICIKNDKWVIQALHPHQTKNEVIIE